MSERTTSSPRRGLAFLVKQQSVVVPILALIVAFVIGAVLIHFQGVNPLTAYKSLFSAALGEHKGIVRTLHKATPLVLTGLAVIIPLRVGLFNIGAQGQLVWGAMMAAWVGVLASGLGYVALPLAILAGVAGGTIWAWIAGALKASRGVHEVISTIMLNSIAVGIVDYLITFPLKESGQPIPRTEAVAETARIGQIGPVPLGFPLAIILAIAVAWMFARTTWGFRFDAVGANRHAATYAGMSYSRVVMWSMALAGVFAGLGGAVETLGVTYRYESSFGGTLGFDGITIALLARGKPMGVIPAAILIGILRSGAPSLQFDTGIQPEIVDLLLAITLLLVSIPLIAKLVFGDRADHDAALASSWGS